MTGLNVAWALGELDEFIRLTDRVPYSSPNVIGTHFRGSDTDIAARAQVVEQILAVTLPNWRMGVSATKREWGQQREAATRARAVLSREQEIRDNLGDTAPRISAADLHPWVWSGASSLWQSGHFRSAVEDAAKKLNAETQNKIGRRGVSESALFKQAFSLDVALPGKSRLRRTTPDDSDTDKSVQRGAMAFAEGIYAGIRNPFNHEDPKDIDEQIALEYLAALSVLARWVDESSAETTS